MIYDANKYDYLHEEEFWADDTWEPRGQCTCFACRFIRCDVGDEEFIEFYGSMAPPLTDNGDFEERMKVLGVIYDCSV
jgi:hypothetical protein